MVRHIGALCALSALAAVTNADVSMTGSLYWVGSSTGSLMALNSTVQWDNTNDMIVDQDDDLNEAKTTGIDGNYVEFLSWRFNENYVFYTAADNVKLVDTADYDGHNYDFLDHSLIAAANDDDVDMADNFWGIAIHQDYDTELPELVYVVARDGAQIVRRRFLHWLPIFQFDPFVEIAKDIPSGLARDLEIDQTNGYLYWTEQYSGVFRATYSRETAALGATEQVVSGTGVFGMTLTDDAIWWTNNGAIYTSDLDGSNVVMVTEIVGAEFLFDIVVNENQRRLEVGQDPEDADLGVFYVSDRLGQMIYRCYTDGSNCGVFHDASVAGMYPRGLSLGATARDGAASALNPSALLSVAFASLVAVFTLRR